VGHPVFPPMPRPGHPPIVVGGGVAGEGGHKAIWPILLPAIPETIVNVSIRRSAARGADCD